MGMKLFYGGFGNYMEFVVAQDEASAINRIGEKLNAPFLPITATTVDGIDGYEILPVSSECTKETANTAEADEASAIAEETAKTSLRHCKKCDFTCETQGQLLAHYREMHSKEG